MAQLDPAPGPSGGSGGGGSDPGGGLLVLLLGLVALGGIVFFPLALFAALICLAADQRRIALIAVLLAMGSALVWWSVMGTDAFLNRFGFWVLFLLPPLVFIGFVAVVSLATFLLSRPVISFLILAPLALVAWGALRPPPPGAFFGPQKCRFAFVLPCRVSSLCMAPDGATATLTCGWLETPLVLTETPVWRPEISVVHEGMSLRFPPTGLETCKIDQMCLTPGAAESAVTCGDLGIATLGLSGSGLEMRPIDLADQADRYLHQVLDRSSWLLRC